MGERAPRLLTPLHHNRFVECRHGHQGGPLSLARKAYRTSPCWVSASSLGCRPPPFARKPDLNRRRENISEGWRWRSVAHHPWNDHPVQQNESNPPRVHHRETSTPRDSRLYMSLG
ncbi:hypothetical protein FA13DRAFT_359989 [Coprinellus micaceus]|uniref:Uncharacterized protein n=1 Tax=Coprinellus micaceus TaxID=71717 RepID=A0A4Y7TBL5_COPMI|nr:hypothetical protein FA13DRAFT_359989 [Coprinellus micaceus]